MGSKSNRREKREALAALSASDVSEVPAPTNLPERHQGLRIIRTARTGTEMIEATEKGFYPLLVKIEPNPKLRRNISVYQNKRTGQVTIFSGIQARDPYVEEEVCILPETWYHPTSSPLPIAAYLLPMNLKIGEKVWLEDVIEDFIYGEWQGNILRLYSSEAIWDGKQFEVKYTGHPRIYG
ncbi:MAG: hypothetical protein QM758_12300 [Armatimonas sp.]